MIFPKTAHGEKAEGIPVLSFLIVVVDFPGVAPGRRYAGIRNGKDVQQPCVRAIHGDAPRLDAALGKVCFSMGMNRCNSARPTMICSPVPPQLLLQRACHDHFKVCGQFFYNEFVQITV